jgi:lipid A 4'-phosphatase
MGRTVASVFRSPAVWLPPLILTVLTILFRVTDLDTACVRPFYVAGSVSRELSDRWPLMSAYPWKALYDWGIYPAWFLGCGGMVVWIVSFAWKKLEPWRDQGLYYGVLLILGPGLLINGLLKPYWGRPRPNSVVQFGGERDFLPVGDWGHWPEESSFPSGHASMGFYLMAPAFVYCQRRPRLALAFLLVGVLSGGTIGLARIVAGGHFPSDVIWAGGLVYAVALVVAAPFRFWNVRGREVRGHDPVSS